MSITDWFSARERRRYKRTDSSQPTAGDMLDGAWLKCDGCKRTLYEGELVDQGRVCRHCGHHFPLTAAERIALITDEPEDFAEFDASLTSRDPLQFSAAKSYESSLASAKGKSGLSEAIVTGVTSIGGVRTVLGVMDFRFIGASMGSVVGEKIARAFERATEQQLPVVMVVASGGARMQEGMLSLMQMAKTSAAVERHSRAGLTYISVLTNPSYGGVTASFAVLADVIIAEPGAMIGFAGPRLVEQTIRQKLPKGFQTAEFMLAHGMIDEVVAREDLTPRLGALLDYMTCSSRGGGC